MGRWEIYKSMKTLELVIDFLETFYDEFASYIDDNYNIDPTEAGVIIEELRGNVH